MLAFATVIKVLVMADTWGRHHDGGGLGWWIAVIWGALIALVVWLLRGGLEGRRETPEETLRRRLADGSISVEEYEQRRAALHLSDVQPQGPRAGPG